MARRATSFAEVSVEEATEAQNVQQPDVKMQSVLGSGLESAQSSTTAVSEAETEVHPQSEVKMQSVLGSESGLLVPAENATVISETETEDLRVAILKDMEVLASGNPQGDYLHTGGEYSVGSDHWVLEQEWVLDHAGQALSTPRTTDQSANHENAMERAKETVKHFTQLVPAEGCLLSPNQIHDDASEKESAFVRSPTTDSSRSIRPCLS